MRVLRRSSRPMVGISLLRLRPHNLTACACACAYTLLWSHVWTHSHSNAFALRIIRAPPSSLLAFGMSPTRLHSRSFIPCHAQRRGMSDLISKHKPSVLKASAMDDAVEADKLVDYYTVPQDDSLMFGDYATIKCSTHTGKVYTDVSALGTTDGPTEGAAVWIRGRLHNVRGKGNSCFLVIRSGAFYTVQALHFKDKSNADLSKQLIKFAASIPLESIVDVQGIVSSADVKSCSQSTVELQIRKIFTVSRAPVLLPFLLEDASRSEEEIDASQSSERPFARVHQDMRLNNRWLDLRVPANNAIMRIQSGVCQLFREALYADGFMEIHTPKLIAGESEGGADVFRTDYFGQSACLAQSPQLYKQMAISADMERVFEIGPVFRAENSHTRRHLCEFTGLDIEMSIQEHYSEVLQVAHKVFKHIFTGLENRYASELAVIRTQYHSEPVTFTEEPCILHFPDAISILRKLGHDVDDFQDLSSAHEIVLGQHVKETYGTDFFMLDQYPSNVRPFYTMGSAHDDRYSNSYDMFLRGQEICSGAQRCHDTNLLIGNLERLNIPKDPLSFYVESFRHACKPHGGAGIGLERVVFLYLGLDNVRKASMFPRDPNRCTP